MVVNPIFVGMIFESFIIGIAVIMVILVLMKYHQKRHKLTFYLFLIFLSYLIAIIFSWLSKVLVLYSGLDYLSYEESASDPGTYTSWILLRISDFRISFVFLTIAIFLSYVLKVNVFEKGYNNIYKYAVVIYSIFTACFSLLAYQKDNTLLDTFAFLLVFLLMSMIYFPFFIRSYEAYRASSEKTFKFAFISLALMSIFFILIVFNFLIDRIIILLIGGLGFTPFYFMAWIFAILGIFGAYFGYIRPKAK